MAYTAYFSRGPNSAAYEIEFECVGSDVTTDGQPVPEFDITKVYDPEGREIMASYADYFDGLEADAVLDACYEAYIEAMTDDGPEPDYD